MPKDFRSMLHRHKTLDQMCNNFIRNLIELRSACMVLTRLRTGDGEGKNSKYAESRKAMSE